MKKALILRTVLIICYYMLLLLLCDNSDNNSISDDNDKYDEDNFALCVLHLDWSKLVPMVALRYSSEFPLPRPPLWSNGQSSWLQIRRPGFYSRHYQKNNGSGTGSTQPREYN
jgi:hypothetical protein